MAPDNPIITYPKTLQMKRLLYIAAASLMLSSVACTSGAASDAEKARLDSLRTDSLNRVRAAADSAARAGRMHIIDSINRHTVSPDLTFFGLHGKVNELTYVKSCDWVGSPRAGTVIAFDTLGHASADVIRHESGRITGMGEKAYGWADGHVTIVGPAEFGANEAEYRRLNRTYVKHSYDSRGWPVKSQVLNNMDEIIIEYTYNVTDTDRFGNWLVREVLRLELEAGSRQELSREVIPEIRTITYHTESL